MGLTAVNVVNSYEDASECVPFNIIKNVDLPTPPNYSHKENPNPSPLPLESCLGDSYKKKEIKSLIL